MSVDGSDRFENGAFHATADVTERQPFKPVTVHSMSLSVPRFTLCAPLKSARLLMDLASRGALACKGKEIPVICPQITHRTLFDLCKIMFEMLRSEPPHTSCSAVYDSGMMILSWGYVKYLLRPLLFHVSQLGPWRIRTSRRWRNPGKQLSYIFILVVQCTKFTSLIYTSSFSECRHNLPIKASDALSGKVCVVCFVSEIGAICRKCQSLQR